MENLEIAKIRIERAIKFSERFDEMSDKEFKWLINYIDNILKLLPNSKDKLSIQAYVYKLKKMEFKKYGAIFKGISPYGGVIIRKKDLNNLVWWLNSLLY
ncbi:MAG: hypothetical protein J7K22_01965 [Nanoarchaeota archaeon]|nr:hypothetical protein [Nanoarchaeota archaeon]